jgi:hypothetical protein
VLTALLLLLLLLLLLRGMHHLGSLA